MFSPLTKKLMLILMELAERYKDSVQIGRTHGRFAEPITFGFYVANYLDRVGKIYKQAQRQKDNLYGKLSGAVGSFAGLTLTHQDPLEIEKRFLAKLNLKPNPTHLSTQIVHPEGVISLLLTIAQGFTIFANLSDDFRHLMRSEIDEIIIKKREKTIGSSTMPHKVNPKDFEQIKSLWKKFIPQVITFFLDCISEHQRDLTNSASARFIGEFLFAYAYCADKLNKLLPQVKFNSAKALEHLEKAKSEIFAEPLYISLALCGEQEPYKVVYELINYLREKPEKEYLETILHDDKFKKVLENPKYSSAVIQPINYTGLCSKLVDNAISYWKKELEENA
jgi:adenylosuccinate lyase